MANSMFFFTCLVFFIHHCKTMPFQSLSRDLEIIKSCNATYPITKDDLNRSLIEKRFSYEPPKNFKCFLRCLYQTNGWIDDKGEFRINVIRETLYESSLDPIIAKHLIRLCTNVDSSQCETAYQFTTCFWRELEHWESVDPSLYSEELLSH